MRSMGMESPRSMGHRSSLPQRARARERGACALFDPPSLGHSWSSVQPYATIRLLAAWHKRLVSQADRSGIRVNDLRVGECSGNVA
jgi:hypothetical protein